MSRISLFFLLANVCILTNTEAKEVSNICKHCEQGLSNARVEVVKKSRSAVVYIETKHENLGFQGFGFDPFESFFGRREISKVPKKQYAPSGSGFIVSQDGYIITNYHVIDGAKEILVEITNAEGTEKEYDAKLIGFDPNTDLAVLKIEEKGLPFLEFGDSDRVNEGQTTIAIGHPYRLMHSVTGGMISAKHRTNIELTDQVDYIQTDAALNPGSSGGPLLDLNGKVIAVNTAIRAKSTGLGFSIPSNIAKMVYEHVKATGSVQRGYLGISLQDLDEDLLQAFSYKKGTKGALITSVEKGSPGDISGLKVGDLIVGFHKKKIKNVKELVIAQGKLSAGDATSIDILRDGKVQSLPTTLGSLMAGTSIQNDLMQRLGVVVKESKGEKERDNLVVIKKVIPGGLAYQSGWKVGSTIVVLNGEKIHSREDLAKALEKNKKEKRMVALLEHDGHNFFTTITTP